MASGYSFAGKTIRQYALLTFCPVVLLNYFQNHFYRLNSVSGSSMSPFLSPFYHDTQSRDWVLFKQNYRHQDLKPGMIVSFLSPSSSKLAVKRIIAMEGDKVQVLPRRATSGAGQALNSLYGHDVDIITVPHGHVWLEGDQVDRNRTYDSNDYGPVSKSLIQGIGLSIVFPSSRRGKIEWETGWEQKCAGRITRAGEDYRKPAEWALYSLQGDEIE